ncbi:B2 protein [Dendrobium catenatum]|uniref:B2 protein n=1 Tax=Dendrobium catenatum TaxID=906689 RepID=A0A2I0X5P6_9ASPA|nr:B2 protein [Dendrobium catenatum]
MENSLWQMGSEFRPEQFPKVSDDRQWSVVTSKLAKMTKSKGEQIKNSDYPLNIPETQPWEKLYFLEDAIFENLLMNMMNEAATNTSFNVENSMNSTCEKSNANNVKIINGNKKNNRKRFKTLPSTETLPRNEILGGYIFICNSDTMKEDLKNQLFCLPPRFRDSVRAITPGLPLFLYNYTTRRLHGVFEAASFGGSNIDPTAWKDFKCEGESMFPAQVRIRTRKICKPLEEHAFRPILHHYYGNRFRFELSIAETLALLDLYEGSTRN